MTHTTTVLQARGTVSLSPPPSRACWVAFVLALGACDRSDVPSRPADPAPVAATASPPATAPRAPAPAPEAPRSFNVILLMIDSLRADMPWAGYERDIAPNLAALEKRSVSYTRAYSISSYTAMSVVPALAGAYPSEMKRDGYFFTRYHDDNVLVSERAQAAGHRTLAGHAHGYFLPALGNAQGFDDYRLIPGGVDLKAVTSITSEKLTKLAIEMLSDPKNASPGEGKRFFAYFHYMDPHHTYERHPGHPEFGKKPRDVYDHEVHYTDSWVGKLLDFVGGQPWGAETAVVVTADHGEAFGENGHFRHAYEVWEPLVRVPWFFVVPGIEPRRIEVPRGHVDLAPTISDLLGLRGGPPFRGRSLLPELRGDDEPQARPVIVELARSDLMDRRRAIIAEGHKLIAFGDDRSFKLFDLTNDPGESKDLSKDSPELLERMKKLYREESAKIPRTPVLGGAPLKGAPSGQRW